MPFLQTGPVIEKLANRIADSDKQVREALKELLAGSLLPQLGEGRLTPFLPLLMAHICSAMTHLQAGIRCACHSLQHGDLRQVLPRNKVGGQYACLL